MNGKYWEPDFSLSEKQVTDNQEGMQNKLCSIGLELETLVWNMYGCYTCIDTD